VIQVTDPATVLYAYGQGGLTSATVLYEYLEANVQTSDRDVVYGWGLETDRWERKAGFWAFSTQEIGNAFPRWHAARLNTGGNTQELINAWGMGFDHVKLEYAEFRKFLFLDTVPLTDPDLFRHAGVVDFGLDVVKDRSKNFLLNPSFAYRGLARRNLPIYWNTFRAKTTGTVALVDTPVFIGSNSVKMHADAGENCYLSQTIAHVVESCRSLTASIWYMVPLPEDTLVAEEHYAGLCLTVVYANGTADIKRVAFDLGTGGMWRRASVTIELEHELYAATFGVQVENDTDHAFRVYLGAAQLESSPDPTPWSEHDLTFVPYQTEDIRTGPPCDVYIDFGTEEVTEEIIDGYPVTYDARSGRTLLYMRNHEALWTQALPMRATTTALSELPDCSTFDMFGWYANPERERFNTRWRIANNLIEQYNADIPAETICVWDIGELHLDEDLRPWVGIAGADEFPTFSRTLEALCVHKGMLWVLCKETEDGSTHRVLKVIDPWSRWPIPLAYDQGLDSLHLECKGDVDIGLSTGTADYLGVLEEDPETFVMRIGSTYYKIELEYDHYAFDYTRAQVIMRNAFAGGELISL